MSKIMEVQPKDFWTRRFQNLLLVSSVAAQLADEPCEEAEAGLKWLPSELPVLAELAMM